jgi:predicted membrane protein
MGIFGSLLALAFNAYHRETYPSAVFEIPRAVSLGESTCQRTLADKPPLLAEISMQLADVRKVAPVGPESACVVGCQRLQSA